MEYLGLILGIVFVALIILSVHFEFADKFIDFWISKEDKFYKILVSAFILIILTLAIFYRFL